MCLNWIRPAEEYEPVSDSYRHDTEHSDSLKGEEFLD
jgi:hypothetical protein